MSRKAGTHWPSSLVDPCWDSAGNATVEEAHSQMLCGKMWYGKAPEKIENTDKGCRQCESPGARNSSDESTNRCRAAASNVCGTLPVLQTATKDGAENTLSGWKKNEKTKAKNTCHMVSPKKVRNVIALSLAGQRHSAEAGRLSQDPV